MAFAELSLLVKDQWSVSYLDEKSGGDDLGVVLVEGHVKLGRVGRVGQVDVLECLGEVFGASDGQADVGVALVALQVVEEVPEPGLGHAGVDVG